MRYPSGGGVAIAWLCPGATEKFLLNADRLIAERKAHSVFNSFSIGIG